MVVAVGDGRYAVLINDRRYATFRDREEAQRTAEALARRYAGVEVSGESAK